MKRILVAEDEKSIRDFIIINLKRAGYDVVAASDGEEALRLYDDYDGDFAIALLDIMMPKMDGMEVCAKLREKSSTLGIVMLTAKAQEMDKVMGLLKGADDYITKPFSLSELMAQLGSCPAFVRPHRAYIVNMDYIRKLSGHELLLTNGRRIPVPQNGYGRLKETYLAYMTRT